MDLLKKDIPSVSDEAVKAIENIAQAQEKGHNIDNMEEWIHQNKIADESIIAFLKDTEYSEKTLVNYQEYLKKSTNVMSLFQRTTEMAGTALKTIGATIGSMAAMWVIGEVISLAVTALDNWINRVQKAKDSINDARNQYETAKSDLEKMNSELETTKEKISEIENKGTLTFTDKEELERLKQQNKELARSISLQEQKQKNNASKTVAEGEKNQSLTDEDFNKNLNDYKTLQKSQQDTIETGQKLLKSKDIDLDNYNFTISQGEEELANAKNKVLNVIEDYEKQKQDVINKYGTDDISAFTQTDKDYYNHLTDQLQKAYKTIYSDSEYNKFVIEPIFDTDKLKDLQNQLLQYFTNGGDTDLSSLEKVFGTDIITALQNACEKTGIDFDKMIQEMYDNSQSKLNQIAPIIKTPNGEADAKQNQISQQIRDYIQNGLSEKDRTILLNAEIPDDVKFNTIKDVDDFIRSLQTEVDTTPLSFNEAWVSLADDTKTSLTELAKSGELTDKTFNKVSGVDDFAESLKKLGLTTDDIIEKINKMQNSADQLSSMKSGISAISNILGTKQENLSSKKTRTEGIGADTLAGLPDEVKESKKEYEEFCNVLGNGSSSMEECKKVANNLATAYVNSNNFLSNLTESNKDYYESVLEEMGVENSAQIIKEKLAEKTNYLAAKKAYATETGKTLVNQTSEEIQRFAEEQGYTEGTTNALLQLALKKELVNNTTLSFENDISAIKDYVKALGGATSALNTMQRIKQGKSVDGNAASTVGMPEEARKFAQEQGQKEVDKALKKNKTKLKIDVEIPKIKNSSHSGSGKSKSGNTKTKDTKQEVNWIERKLTVLQAKIDTTSGKLQNLFSIKAKKNNINKQLTETQNLLNANRKAAKAYQKEANKVKLSGKLKAKVRSGDYDITKYSSKTADKINQYQDYIDKAREARDAIQDNIVSIHELNQQKLDNIVTWYDKLLAKINAVTSKFQTKADLTSKIRSMLGQAETGTKTEYKNTLQSQTEALKTSQKEYKAYEKERKAQRKELTGQTNAKNRSDRKTTKEFLKRSGLSDAQIKKELKKFDTQRGKLKDKQLEDFDATTKEQSAQLKEAVISSLSDMLDTAQDLANVPLEKLQTTLDNLSTDFTKLENQASRASKQLEDVGIGLGYLEKVNASKVSNKQSAVNTASTTYRNAVSNRDSLVAQLRANGVDPTGIKTSDDLIKFADNTPVANIATQYLASISAVDSAFKTLNETTEDLRNTIDDVVSSEVDAKNNLLDKDIEEQDRQLENWKKKRNYTDNTVDNLVPTSYFNTDKNSQSYGNNKINTIIYAAEHSNHADDYVARAESYRNDANGIAKWLQGINGMYTGSLSSTFATVEKLTANLEVIPEEILETIKKEAPDQLENLVKYNEYLKQSDSYSKKAEDAQYTYDYETVPQMYKDIFAAISTDADRTVGDIQDDIDHIENYLQDNLLTDTTDSYMQEASKYKDQADVYEKEVAEKEKWLAEAEANGMVKGSDDWNALNDEIETAKKNQEESSRNYTNALVNAFNSIGDIADRSIKEIDKNLSRLNSEMSMLEAQGHFVTSDFYEKQGDYYAEQQVASQKKATDLQTELDELVESGDIEEYSSRWYEMKDKVDDASQAALDFGVKVKEAAKSAFDTILQVYDKSGQAITRMNDEADFYIDVLGRDKLVNDKTGAFTSNGLATMSLYFEKMTNDIVLKDNLLKKKKEIEDRYQNGTNPDYGIEEYNEDMDNVNSEMRDVIKNTYDANDAIKSLIEDGLNKQLEVLQDIVDKYKEAMDAASDLRDYQNQVDDATKNIASLQKQLEVVSGNDSEEGRATAQSLQKQLEDAQKDLDDIEWDKKKSDMEDILDQMMDDAQDHIDEKLDQITDVIEQLRDLQPENVQEVYNALKGIDARWGAQISDNLAEGVKLGDYSTILSGMDSAAEKIAQAVYDSEKGKLEGNGQTSQQENSSDNNSNSGTQGTQSGQTKDNSTSSGSYKTKARVTPAPKIASQETEKDKFKALMKNYLSDSTSNEKSNPRTALDKLTKTTSSTMSVFARDLGLDGIIPDSSVLELLHKLGFGAGLDNAPLSMQISTLKSVLEKKIESLGGFSRGGIVDKINKQVRRNNDDALISVKSGEGILTPQQTAMFQKLVESMPSLVDLSKIKLPTLPSSTNSSKNITVEMGDMHFDLPNVTDTDSFINAWKSDTKLKNFVADVVSGTVTGDNSKAMRY